MMTTEPQAQPPAASKNDVRYQNQLLDRAIVGLDEIMKCEGRMCMHCIDLLCENVQPMLARLQELRGMDLPRAAADALSEIEVALISIADGVSPHDAVQKAFDVINRERLAANPTRRAETGLTVEAWQPIETSPKNEEWCVVGKISEGKVLWWYRAMYWRGGWHTSRSYDTRIEPSHYLPLPEPGITWAKSRAEKERSDHE